MESPPREDQWQPVKAERDRWLWDSQGTAPPRGLYLHPDWFRITSLKQCPVLDWPFCVLLEKVCPSSKQKCVLDVFYRCIIWLSPHDLIDIQSCISIALSLPRQFLQDTLDTLFGILDESSQRYGLKVFDCLVSGYCFCGLPFPSILFSPSLTANRWLILNTTGWSQDWSVMTAQLIVFVCVCACVCVTACIKSNVIGRIYTHLADVIAGVEKCLCS